MWYLVSAAAGLLLGLVLLVWALKERSAKHHAQSMTVEVQKKLEEEISNHHATQVLLTAASQKARRLEASSDSLRTMLKSVRERLMECRDPETVKSWLDDEMQDKDV